MNWLYDAKCDLRHDGKQQRRAGIACSTSTLCSQCTYSPVANANSKRVQTVDYVPYATHYTGMTLYDAERWAAVQ